MIESWREPVAQSLLTTFSEQLEYLPEDKYSIDFVKSFLKTSSTFNNLKTEMNALFSYYAWHKQVLYFRKLKACFQNNIPLSEKTIVIAVEGVPLEMQFYVRDAVDQMLSNLQAKHDDEGYVTDMGDNVDNELELSAMNSSSDELINWKEYMKTILKNMTYSTVEFVYVESTIRVILSYIASMRDSNMPPSEAEFNFNHKDKQLKQAILKYTSSNKSEQKSKFLATELHDITNQIVDNNGRKELIINIIKNSIKYGYPLPLSSAELVAKVFDKFLKSSGIYKSGINLEIKDKNNNVLVNYNTGKVKLSVRDFNGYVYICQSDYRSFIGMSDQMNEEVDNGFFYEAFISFMKNLREKFPKKAETLREGLLKELENL